MLTSCILQLSHNCKVMPLLLNILFRWLQIFFQGSSTFFFFFFHGWSHHLQWFWSPKKYSLSLFPFPPMFSLFDVKWLDQLPWSSFFQCWDLSQVFHSPLFFISRLFSYSSLFVIYVVSRAYLRLLIFLQAILILVWVSSSLALHTMCSEYKLDKPHNNIQPWCTPFQFETSAFFHVQF